MKKLVLMLICYFGVSTMANAEQQKIAEGGFVHTVFFWLNNPDNTQEREAFENHLTKFIDASKYVKSKHIGTKASSPRDVVDSSYDYCLIVTFANKEEQDKYQTEDVHLTFVKDAAHLWKNVVVYDSNSIL
ncbi:Dabb family protein [Paraglaciecola aquimarina]|uniref:Dabb family protein n=1 Tax=Paraglaciecola algarum TaxID=3050085 RepID=A0ABS9D3M6_9ALTE|nr:Dabb family protein [Paraglaciecola sp. G1-23]MCF2946627.1 Dabb family protein [Paraglaciecola sp. G1-23]